VRKGEARITHLSVLLAAASGFVYGALLYCGETEDDFGPVAHPWGPTLHTLHVVTVPLFVFAFGMLWQHHIVHKLRSGAKARRATGVILLSQAIPMIVTGYFLQVAVDDVWRDTWIWAHVITSTLFSLVFVVHLLMRVGPVIKPNRT
jgi:hypothetical protein